MMNKQNVSLIVKGIVAGGFVGFLLGGFCSQLITDAVIQRDDFTHPLLYEQTEQRLIRTLLITSTLVCAVLGALLSWTDFGPRLRPVLLGCCVGIALGVAIALPIAWLRNEQPFNHMKGAESDTIDVARRYGLPLMILLGAAGGYYFAWRRESNEECS